MRFHHAMVVAITIGQSGLLFAEPKPLQIPTGAYLVKDVLSGSEGLACISVETLQLLTPQGWIVHVTKAGASCSLLDEPIADENEVNWRARCSSPSGSQKVIGNYKLRVLWLPGTQLVVSTANPEQGTIATTAKPAGVCTPAMPIYRPWG